MTEKELWKEYQEFLKGALVPRKKRMFGPETQKAHERRLKEGFYKKYCQGVGLDIGHSAASGDCEPITNAIGVDKDYPGYDGIVLPFHDNSKDFVYSSHCLEHIDDYRAAIQDWYRVTTVNGYIIITVPHKFLYEKRNNLPSRFNEDHKRMYTGASLLTEIEQSLLPNSYRIIYLRDCAHGFDYNIPPTQHSSGEYQLELVLQKITPPDWKIE